MNISDKLKRFRQKYKIEAKENVEVYELLKLDTRDTRTNLKTGANYAKIKIKFVRVMKILRLKSLEHEEVMIQFAEVDTVNNWANCYISSSEINPTNIESINIGVDVSFNETSHVGYNEKQLPNILSRSDFQQNHHLPPLLNVFQPPIQNAMVDHYAK
ncbi:hypothetical protein C6P40_001514 [Pichia californica]|uniref:Uncharacterized protein n=1 Tax=Pichia californica TaxID=460514 RepID=A0A9P6WIZ1_9ASCO|nr:hypothetical protein C6P42_003926 [[Candida] californica]KAG0688020.1 hypothetical protein C6P40_001514 [[Candida] californica]